MLMVVVEKKPDGMIGTRYVYPGWMWNKHKNVPFKSMPKHFQRHYGKIWRNDKKYLHDPSRFGIEIPEKIDKYWE